MPAQKSRNEPRKGRIESRAVRSAAPIPASRGNQLRLLVPGCLCQICLARASIRRAIGTSVEMQSSLQKTLAVKVNPHKTAQQAPRLPSGCFHQRKAKPMARKVKATDEASAWIVWDSAR